MNISMLKKWIEALRSGEYKQAQGCLIDKTTYNEPRFCCLGVLSDLYAVDNPNEFTWEGLIFKNKLKDEYSLAYLLSSIAKDALGSQKHNGTSVTIEEVCDREDMYITLAGLNDDGFTFDQIADVIEYFFLKSAERNV
jgi:hypothetical protein